MTTTPEVGRWDALVAARTRGEVGDGIAMVLAFLGVPDLISFAGGFPDPETFPRERVSTLFQELAASGEATAFQYAPTRGLARAPGRTRRPDRDPAGSAPRRRRAADHERRHRGARAGRQVVSRPRRPGRRRRPHVPGLDPGVPRVRGEARRRRHGRARARRGGPRAAARRWAPPEARLQHPRPPEPGRREPCRRAANAARRAGAALRVPDRRGRGVP